MTYNTLIELNCVLYIHYCRYIEQEHNVLPNLKNSTLLKFNKLAFFAVYLSRWLCDHRRLQTGGVLNKITMHDEVKLHLQMYKESHICKNT